jgi:hypothetical protein
MEGSRGNAFWDCSSALMTCSCNERHSQPENSKIYLNDRRTILSKWSETRSHHFLISFLNARFCRPSFTCCASGEGADAGVYLSNPRVICNFGTLSSKISSIGDKAIGISVEWVEKWRMMLNLDQGNVERGPDGGLVCSQRDGVKTHIEGE